MNDRLAYHVMIETRLKGRSLDNWSTPDKYFATVTGTFVIGFSLYLMADRSLPVGFGAFLILSLLWVSLLSRGDKAHFRFYYLMFVKPIRLAWLKLKKKRNWWVTGEKPIIDLTINYVAARNLENVVKQFALSHNARRNTDHLIVRTQGGLSASKNGTEQLELATALAKIYNQTLSESSLSAGIATIRVMSPHNEYEFVQHMSEHGDPIVFATEEFALTNEDRAFYLGQQDYYSQLMPAMENRGSADNWELHVVTIKRRSEWTKATKGRLSADELYDLPVIQLGENLVMALQESPLGYSDVRVLEPHELFLLYRCSWDVYGIKDFYKKYSSIVARHKGDPKLINRLEDELSCWPEEIIASPYDDCARFDSNWIGSVRITKTPEKVLASEVLALHSVLRPGPNVWIRHYNGGVSLDGSRETTALWVNENLFQNIQDAFFSKSVVAHPEIGKKKREMHDKTQLASSHSISQLYNEYWTIVCPNYRTFRSKARVLMATLRAWGYECELVDDPIMHLDIVLTSTLGA